MTAFRSNQIKFFDAVTLAEVLSHDYEADMDFISPGLTIAGGGAPYNSGDNSHCLDVQNATQTEGAERVE